MVLKFWAQKPVMLMQHQRMLQLDMQLSLYQMVRLTLGPFLVQIHGLRLCEQYEHDRCPYRRRFDRRLSLRRDRRCLLVVQLALMNGWANSPWYIMKAALLSTCQILRMQYHRCG